MQRSRDTEAEEFMLTIECCDPRIAHGIKLDPLGLAQHGDSLIKRAHIKLVAEIEDGRDRIVDHLGTQVVGAVAHAHLAVAHGNRAGQAAGKFELEVGQAEKAERAAKADHGWLAHVGPARDFGNGFIDHGAWVFQHQLGHAPFSWWQFILQLGNALHQRVIAILAAQVLGKNRRNTVEGRIGGGNDVGWNLRQIRCETPLGFKTRTE